MRKLILSAAAAAALMAAASAHATPQLIMTLTDTGTGGGSLSCTLTAAGFAPGCAAGFDEGVFNGAGALEGEFGGTIFGFRGSFISSTSNTPGNALFGEITFTFNNVRNVSSDGSLVISLAASGFTLPAGPALTLTGSQALTSNTGNGGTIGAMYYASASGAPLASTAATASTATSLLASTANSINAAPVNWLRASPGAFSLENIITFALPITTQGVQGTSNLEVRNTVPEPMTTALVGLGLFGAALFSRRRKSIKG